MAYDRDLGHRGHCAGCHLANVRLYHGALSGWSALHPRGTARSRPDRWRQRTCRSIATSSFPLLSPVTLSALIILGHMSLKVFDLIIAVAGKQLPLDVPAIYMWQTTFDGLFYGRGAAIGISALDQRGCLDHPLHSLHPQDGGPAMKSIASASRQKYWLYIPLIAHGDLLPGAHVRHAGDRLQELCRSGPQHACGTCPRASHFDNFIEAFSKLAPSPLEQLHHGDPRGHYFLHPRLA